MDSNRDETVVKREKLAQELYIFALRSILDNSFKEKKFVKVLSDFLCLDEEFCQQLSECSMRQQRVKLLAIVKESAMEDFQSVENVLMM